MEVLISLIVFAVLASLFTAGWAILECSKLLNEVDSHKHSLDILEQLYDNIRNNTAEECAKIDKTLVRVDTIIDNCSQVLDHEAKVIEEQEKLRHDISMLEMRLEDLNDNTSA